MAEDRQADRMLTSLKRLCWRVALGNRYDAVSLLESNEDSPAHHFVGQ